MTREEKVLSHVRREGKGLEIGAGYNPIAPRKKGFNVDVLDHLPKDELVEKYQGHNVPVENIEEVDFVWNGEPYAELIGKRHVYDWIIASHVIEHTPDFIGFLKECDTILKPDGVVALVVPDVRYHFDFFRPITGISKIIDAHVRQSRIHTEGTVAEFFLDIVSKGGLIAWGECSPPGDMAFLYCAKEAMEKMETVRKKQIYIDAHAWQFTPSSFRLLIHDLHTLGMIPFQEISFQPTDLCEFYVTLGRNTNPPTIDRLEFLKRIHNELLELDANGNRIKQGDSQPLLHAVVSNEKDACDMPIITDGPQTRLGRIKQHARPLLQRVPLAYPTARGIYRVCRSIPRMVAGGRT